MVTVLPEAGLKVRPAAPDRVVKDESLVEPSTATVWVRVAQAAAGGSLSTTRETDCALPRSTVSDCGNALLALSQ